MEECRAEQKLAGKTVALTGATGGLGRVLCARILEQGGRLLLAARTRERGEALARELKSRFPEGEILCLWADLEQPRQAEQLEKRLLQEPVDILYLNAGDYYRERTPGRLDPVFRINFLSQYSLARALLPGLQERKGRLIVTGSIAHLAVRTDETDPDFSRARSPEAVYGNAKRYLMFACGELAKQYPDVTYAVAHPGITPTGITGNYPRVLQKLIRLPMKLTFQPPEKAARGMVLALTEEIPALHWAGPRFLNIWGKPAISPLTSCPAEERTRIYAAAEALLSAENQP